MKEYFEYGGYHFSPYRQFNDKENPKKNSTFVGTRLTSFKICPENYSYKDFYDRIKGSPNYVDLFFCKEAEGVFCPTNGGLNRFNTIE